MKKYNVNVNGYAYEVEIEEMTPGTESGTRSYEPVAPIRVENKSLSKAAVTSSPGPASQEGTTINAPMQGKILDIKVAQGEAVSHGQVVAILEAMKMENEIVASEAGTVASVNVSAGQSVDAGDVLITM